MITGTEQLGFAPIHRVGLFLFGFVLTLLVLELVRRDLLKERYALLWLVTAGGGLFLGAFPSIIIWVSSLLRFQYLTVVVVISLLFVLGLVLSFSVVISKLAEQNRRLTQEVALLKHVVDELSEK